MNKASSSVTSLHPHNHTHTLQRKSSKVKFYFIREEQERNKFSMTICKMVKIS